MDFEFGYGKEKRFLTIPDRNVGSVLEAKKYSGDSGPGSTKETGAPDEKAIVRSALKNPIGSPSLREIVQKGEKIVIITSDVTRPMPSSKVLPSVIEELAAAGISYSDITVILALGNHRKHTEEEKKKLVGEKVYNLVRCIDSDQNDVMHLGKTASGTPVDIHTSVAEADKRIALGNIEFHYFAGYSGGMKAIMPGVSTMEAIQANHSHMVKPEAIAGKIEGNPVREDMDSVYKYCPLHFIVNVVLDEKKHIIKAFAGDVFKAHREGCAFLDTIYKNEITELADIVVVTPGGYPKDINLYQAQKALDNAKHAVKKGGIIVFLAACTEGLGEKVFERWMMNAQSPQEMIDDIQKHFELGGHKAAAIGIVETMADVFFVSEFDPDVVKNFFMRPFPTIEEAFTKAREEKGEDALVHVMPFGGSTLPVLV